MTDWTEHNSSNIAATRYVDERGVMQIKFKSGQTYEYKVPKQVHTKLVSAPSVGQHFHLHIKNTHEATRV